MKVFLTPLALLLTTLLYTSCTTDGVSAPHPTIVVTEFGDTPAGPARLFTLTNAAGTEVQLTNYGGIVTAVRTPDREGQLANVVLGFDRLDGYLAEHPYFGALIGRYGNRIAGGSFTLAGQTYSLPRNDGPHSLHGGEEGFDDRLWRADTFRQDGAVNVRLTYLSPAGEEGYPGNLDVTVTYALTPANELTIDYRATTDAPTPVNLTNHSYFNLTGRAETILGHELRINAGRFTPVDAGLIPTGELRPVAGTPFDFTTAKPIGRDLGAGGDQLDYGCGYDHNFVLDDPARGTLRTAAEVYEPTTGRTLTVLTDQPGLQFYSGNFLDGTNVGRDGRTYHFRYGLCLETQHFPDSPNQPSFPNTVLRPGEEYRTQTVYRFGVRGG